MLYEVITGLRLWFVSYFEKHLPALVAIWFLGFVFLFLKYVGGMVWMLRLKSIAQPVSESIQELIIKLSLKLNVARLVRGASSLKIVTPIVIGHAKPMILFPATVLTGLSAEQLETIILHELAHINRNDYLVNLIQSFLETVFFFHPGIWWLSSALRTEREHAVITSYSIHYTKLYDMSRSSSSRTRAWALRPRTVSSRFSPSSIISTLL